MTATTPSAVCPECRAGCYLERPCSCSRGCSLHPALNAIQTRNAQFANIDRLLAEVTAIRQDMAAKLKGLPADNWRSTGRGSDLELIEQGLAEAFGRGR